MSNDIDKSQTTRYKTLTVSLVLLVISMLLLSFAAIPLYSLFCKATGFNGTTKKVGNNFIALVKGKKELTIEFDANVDKKLPWHFAPKQRIIKTLPGQVTLVFYESENLSNKDIVGISIYNVTPSKAGKYFVKVHCFCFEEQLLKAHQKALMPVTFFIDPAFEKDKEMEDIDNITLSYSFFKIKEL